MKKSKKNQKISDKESELDFKGLEFEEVLEGLLQIKPIENEDLKKDKPNKKKSKTKSEKK